MAAQAEPSKPTMTLKLILTIKIAMREDLCGADFQSETQSAEAYMRALEIFRDARSPYRKDTQAQ